MKKIILKINSYIIGIPFDIAVIYLVLVKLGYTSPQEKLINLSNGLINCYFVFYIAFLFLLFFLTVLFFVFAVFSSIMLSEKSQCENTKNFFNSVDQFKHLTKKSKGEILWHWLNHIPITLCVGVVLGYTWLFVCLCMLSITHYGLHCVNKYLQHNRDVYNEKWKEKK